MLLPHSASGKDSEAPDRTGAFSFYNRIAISRSPASGADTQQTADARILITSSAQYRASSASTSDPGRSRDSNQLEHARIQRLRPIQQHTTSSVLASRRLPYPLD